MTIWIKKKKHNNNGVDELLKLSTSSDTSYTNMNLHNEDCQIMKYDTVYEIMENFYTIRLRCIIIRRPICLID